MGYMHILNLQKKPQFLELAGSPVYAMEKVHGSSASVTLKVNPGGEPTVTFHAGGESHANFVKFFNVPRLIQNFIEIAADNDSLNHMVVHGEVYGGRCQKMSDTYGPELRFIAFDVHVNGKIWLTVSDAEDIAVKLGLEFVPYEIVNNTLADLDRERDRPSVVAERRGMGTDKPREGIVIRPLVEIFNEETAERLMVKYKRAEFRETSTIREVVDLSKIQVLNDADAIAKEWVVDERLNHVTSKLVVDGQALTIRDMPKVLDAMVEDVKREAEGEIVWSPEAERAIKNRTRDMFKRLVLAK